MEDAVKPRIKVTAACEACRRRKARCDGITPCSHCLKSGGTCIYPQEPVKRGPKKGAKYRKRGSVQKPEVPVQQPQVDHPHVSAHSVAPREVDAAPPRPSSPRLGPTVSQIPTMNIPPEVVIHLVEIFFSHVNAQAGVPVLHQPTFLRSLAQREISSALLYAISAASAAFSTHPSILHLSTQSITPDLPPPLEPRTPGDVWALAARQQLQFDPAAQFSIDGIQTLVILSLFELARGRGTAAWMDLGAATRTSQLLSFDDERHEVATDAERELRRRAVWSTYAAEVILGCGTDSTSLLGGSTSSGVLDVVPLPMAGHFDERGLQQPEFSIVGEEEDVPTAFVDGGRIIRNLHLCGVDPFLCRAVYVWGRVNRFVHARKVASNSTVVLAQNMGGVGGPSSPTKEGQKDWDADSSFAALSLELSSWSMHLPVPFLFNPKVIQSLPPTQLSPFYTMHILHHLGQICLHRSYIPNFLYRPHHAAASSEPRSGAAIFATSCHSKAVVHAISLARVLVSATKSAAFPLSPLAGFASFTASTALLADADIRGSTAGSQALQFFLRFLATGMTLYTPLKTFHATLVHLLQIHQAPIPQTLHLPAPPSPGSEYFFRRYASWGIDEPALAPLQTSFARAVPPAPAPVGSKEEPQEDEGVDSYLSSLREIMAAVDGGTDDGASPSTSDARRGSHSTRAGGGGGVEEYSPSNPGLFAGFGCFPGATAGSPAPPDPFLSLLASSQAPSPGPSNASYHHHHASHEHHPDSYQHHPEPQQQQHAFDPALPSFHPAAADLQSPSSMFEWLLSAPVAEDFWDSSALDSFLAVAGGEADIGGGAGEGFEWMM